MARDKKCRRQATQEEAMRAAQDLQSLIQQAQGEKREHPLFKGFIVSKKVTDTQWKGADHFKKSKWAEALTCFKEALKILAGSLRYYAQGSLEHLFDPELRRMSRAEFDTDLFERAERAINALRDLTRVREEIDLEQASQTYWASIQVIDKVDVEMEQRRAKREVEATAAAEAAAAEELKAQQAHQREVEAGRQEENMAMMEDLFGPRPEGASVAV